MTKKKYPLGRVAFLALSFTVLLLILENSSLSIEYAKRGMKLCTTTVIPSLFPFMVASELIVASGGASVVGKIFKRPFYTLFGIGGDGSAALLLGMICGFPVGTRAALSLWRDGKISSDELSRLVCFSNTPSSAFVISAVGVSVFGSQSFGVALFIMCLVSSAIVGMFLKIFSFAKKFDMPDISSNTHEKALNLSRFAACISSAALSMLTVCAFVIFFSVITGAVDDILSKMKVRSELVAVIVSFFELTGGVSAAASIKSYSLAAEITAFCVGWSGFSVHLQLMSICDGAPINYRRYFASKLVQGLLNVLFTYIFLSFFEKSFSQRSESVGYFEMLPFENTRFGFIVRVLFIASVTVFLFRWLKERVECVKFT